MLLGPWRWRGLLRPSLPTALLLGPWRVRGLLEPWRSRPKIDVVHGRGARRPALRGHAVACSSPKKAADLGGDGCGCCWLWVRVLRMVAGAADLGAADSGADVCGCCGFGCGWLWGRSLGGLSAASADLGVDGCGCGCLWIWVLMAVGVARCVHEYVVSLT